MSASISQSGGGLAVSFAPQSTVASAVSPEERLLALIVHTQCSQMRGAETSVHLSFEQLEQLREQVKKALDEAREAKKDQGFWGGLAKIFGSDLASIATAVAAVAAVVASGGAAAAVLAVVAAAATLAADHAEALGIPPEVAMAIAISASVASLCVGDAKGLLKVSQAVKQVAEDVQLCGEVSSLVFKAEGSGLGIVASGYEHDARHFHADARFAEGRQDIVSADIDDALERLAAALESQNGAARLTRSIQQQSTESNYAVLSNWGGVA